MITPLRSSQPLGLVALLTVLNGIGLPTALAADPAQPPPQINLGITHQENDYVLGAGDQIKVTVLNEPELSGEQQVLLDGSIILPMIGSIRVQGTSLSSAATVLEGRLAAFLKYPDVTVSLLQSRTFRIQVLGAVQRPGGYSVASSRNPAGSTSDPILRESVPRLTQLLQLAGGITQRADIRAVEIRRLSSQGDLQTQQVNLWALLQGDPSQVDPVVQDGDTVWIPLAETVDPAELAQASSATFAPSTINVNVIGEVQKPGQLAVTPNTPLNGAILAAGGFSPKAEASKVQLIRLNANGSVETRDIPFNLAQGLDPALNPPLQNADVIVVRPSGVVQTGQQLENTLNPLNLLLQPLVSIGNLWRVIDVISR